MADEVTVVAIDHRPDAHLAHADRMIVLDQGRIVLDAAPEQILGDSDVVRRFGLRTPGAVTPPEAPVVDGEAPGEQGKSALHLSAVEVTVGRTRILRDLGLSLPPGAIAVLTGDNGAGKSTLLRLLATELRPTAGHISPRARARIRAGIGYAPQRSAAIMLTRTVRDEIASAVTRGGKATNPATRQRAEHVLSFAGLSGLAQVHPLTLSGGRRQRLAVALALAGEPALMLLDEPHSAQHRAGTEHIRRLVEEDRGRRVTIISTHDPHAFTGIATHQVHLSDGRITSTTTIARTVPR